MKGTFVFHRLQVICFDLIVNAGVPQMSMHGEYQRVECLQALTDQQEDGVRALAPELVV